MPNVGLREGLVGFEAGRKGLTPSKGLRRGL